MEVEVNPSSVGLGYLAADQSKCFLHYHEDVCVHHHVNFQSYTVHCVVADAIRSPSAKEQEEEGKTQHSKRADKR
ncbi:hypothetical protein Dimus_023386 [Dionaea muscipula]